MGRDQGGAAAQGELVGWQGLPDQAKLFEYVRATKVAKDEVTSEVGDAAAAHGQEAKT